VTQPEGEEPRAARGSDADYCSAYPVDGHAMHSRSGGRLVKWVEICSLCGWINTAALDGWAEAAVKEALAPRAVRIAVAAETEPFAFVQSSTEDLPLSEILLQALGAASMCWEHVDRAGVFNDVRAAQIGKSLQAEVEAALERQDRRTEARLWDEAESRANAR
jgi:hypothetical protein